MRKLPCSGLLETSGLMFTKRRLKPARLLTPCSTMNKLLSSAVEGED